MFRSSQGRLPIQIDTSRKPGGGICAMPVNNHIHYFRKIPNKQEKMKAVLLSQYCFQRAKVVFTEYFD